jgi:hypothetical protein
MRALAADNDLRSGTLRGVIATLFALALALSMAVPATAQEGPGQGIYLGQMEAVDEEAQTIQAQVAHISEELEGLPDDLERAFEEEDPEVLAETFQQTFHLTHDDDYYVNFEETTKEDFLCVAAINVEEDHLFAAIIPDGEDDDNGDDNGLPIGDDNDNGDDNGNDNGLPIGDDDDNGDDNGNDFEQQDLHDDNGDNGDNDDGSTYGLLVENDECPDDGNGEPRDGDTQPQPRDGAQPVEQPRRIDTGAGGTATPGLAAIAGLLALTAAGVTVARRFGSSS